MESHDSPQSLVFNGRLVLHDIYRTAKLSERNTALVKGKISDQFTNIILNDTDPWDGKGLLPSCDKALSNGDIVHSDQWKSSLLWHVGLSCHLFLKSKQNILFDVKNIDFLHEFNNPRRYENIKNETGSYRIFLMFELKKGTIIPNDIGIEIDGNNHVCLYPTGNNILISDIEEGLFSFTIDTLKAIEDKWKPYALYQVRSDGFAWTEDFPSDSEIFPFRQWVSLVINCGEADIAIDASNHIEDYLSQQLDLQDFLLKMIDISYRYSYDCTYDHIDMNRCVLKALRFALNINSLVKERR